MNAAKIAALLLLGSVAVGTTFSVGTGEAAGPSSSGPVVLRWLHNVDNFDPEQDMTKKGIMAALGYDVRMVGPASPEKIQLALSAGEDFDIMTTTNRALFSSLVESGALADLSESVKKYGPNITSSLSPQILDMLSVNGKLYGLPREAENIIDDTTMIRKDWLDKLGMKVPETPDEFYAMLVAFKQKDPGGVGQGKVIPWIFPGKDSVLRLNGISQAFGLGATPSDYVLVNGKLVCGVELKETKEYVKFLSKLVAEGLLSVDFVSSNYSAVDTVIASGAVGVATTQVWYSSGTNAALKNVPGASFVTLPPLKNAAGERKIRLLAGIKDINFVPKTSKKTDEVVKFANAFLDDKYYRTLILGEENVHHKVVNGKYFPILPAFDALNKGRAFYPVNAASKYNPLFFARAHKETRAGIQYDEAQEFKRFAYAMPTVYSPMLPEVQEYAKKLESFADETIIKMVYDPKLIDSWDSFVADWKTRGGDKLTAAYNVWYAKAKK